MCGIAGFFDTRRARPPDEAERVVAAMTDSLAHRGPDGHGLWCDAAAGVGLGHRRLAIIDLSELGHQPMVSADGRYVMTYNGEVYNFQDLRAELADKGHSFRGGSDTEVILAAVLEWGVAEALPRLWGMFALAIWDRQERRLILARDRIGVKPLYWRLADGLLTFGSELRALEAHPAFSAAIDREAAAALVRYSYIPAPASIYEGVEKLPAGSLLVLSQDGPPRVERWWRLKDRLQTPADRDTRTLGDAEATDRLEALISDAVGRRMISDVPLGAFLSGGIDSSTVVALMQAQRTQKVRTFSIGFHEEGYDEAVHAKAVARHLGTDHTELYVDAQTALDVVPRLPDLFDEPFADSSQIPTYLVSAMTRDHVTVALSGDGGDELFAGYPRYIVADQVWRRMSGMPAPVRRAAGHILEATPAGLIDGIGRLIPAKRRPPRLGRRARRLGGLLALPGDDSLHDELSAAWRDREKLVPDAEGRLRLTPDPELRRVLPDLIARMQYYDTERYLPDDIMAKVDRASMAVSLEAREPLLDHRLIEFVWSLPQHMKLRGGQGKWLLREVLARHVPRAMFERPKMGFSIPLDDWLRGPLCDWATAMLTDPSMVTDGIFDAPAVARLWEDHRTRQADHATVLWSILMLQAWTARRRSLPASPAQGQAPAARRAG
ncbi:asparagine synthase (glutamine-hydrolyzing) [Roseospira navarrensis]|uniref:asparagine synthase (glutamine-hydrolyzing) n=1 Tax=Roseospira navarrensis TaxID=140058 RepID=A0A7X2D484_9PROT|nr:asparagine synthase (glutamine-hydrolyzing) [Roseospira navarrensis]MQX36367.1 asparagine synthase (glutamine-hydrolyzing) [Roseospira navarrensis]